MRVVSIGELLWDVFEDFEQLAGAPLNFAVDMRRLGHEVDFVSAVGNDHRGQDALRLLDQYGLSTDFVRRVDDQPTGYVDVTVSDDGEPTWRIRRPAAYDSSSLSSEELDEIASHDPQWIYYGTAHQMSSAAKELTGRLVARFPSARRFYDMNLRKDCFSRELVGEILERASILKLNEEEARESCDLLGGGFRDLESFCSWASDRFDLEGVCVTRGKHGCMARVGEEWIESPGFEVTVKDTGGSGDAFAAGFLHGLDQGWALAKVCEFANRLGALIATKEGALPQWSTDELKAISTPRASG